MSFERSSFIELPERFPPLRRSFRLIEKKRTCLVSRILANGPVPADPTPNHQPCNSFDQSGMLLKEAWMFEDIQIPSNVRSSSSVPIATALPSLPIPPTALEWMSNSIWKEVSNAAVDEFVWDLAQQLIRHKKILKSARRILEDVSTQAVRCVQHSGFCICSCYDEKFRPFPCL